VLRIILAYSGKYQRVDNILSKMVKIRYKWIIYYQICFVSIMVLRVPCKNLISVRLGYEALKIVDVTNFKQLFKC